MNLNFNRNSFAFLAFNLFACLVFLKGAEANVLVHIREGSLEGARKSVARLQNDLSKMGEEERAAAEVKLIAVKNLFSAEKRLQDAVQEVEDAQNTANMLKKRAKEYLVPSKLTGKIATNAAESTLRKAKSLLENAATEMDSARKNMQKSLIESDLSACHLYRIGEREDASNLSEAVELMKRKHDFFSLKTEFRAAKVKAERYEKLAKKEEVKTQRVRDIEDSLPPNDLLWRAVAHNDAMKAKKALDRGADPNLEKGDLMIEAIEKDYLEIVQLLIAKGGKVDTRNDDGRRVYYAASTDRMKTFLRTVGFAPDKEEEALIDKGWYALGKVTEVTEAGFLMKKMERNPNPVKLSNGERRNKLRVTPQLVYVEFNKGGATEEDVQKKKIAEGDVCFFCYTERGNYKKELHRDKVQTLQKLVALNKTLYIKDYEDSIYKGRVFRMTDDGVLAYVTAGENEAVRAQGRLVYIDKHPRIKELYDNAPIYIHGDRVEAYIYERGRGQTQIIPHLECVNDLDDGQML